jgi:hypothetical protein
LKHLRPTARPASPKPRRRAVEGFEYNAPAEAEGEPANDFETPEFVIY